MPLITVSMYPGRTQEQKEEYAKAITKSAVEILKTKDDIILHGQNGKVIKASWGYAITFIQFLGFILSSTYSISPIIKQFKNTFIKDENLKKIISYILNPSTNSIIDFSLVNRMFYTNSSQTSKELASLSEKINGNFI